MSINNARTSSGFTLVELVTVIILIGILSALGVGLFARSSAFSPLLVTQQLQSATLLAQQAALAGNPFNFVRIQQTAGAFQFEAAGSEFSIPRQGSTLKYSANGADNFVSLPPDPEGVKIYFDSLARVAPPYKRQNIDFKITGDSGITDDSEFNLCLSSLGAVYQGRCQQ